MTCTGDPDTHAKKLPTVGTECDWLLSHVGWIAEQQWANEITEDVCRMLDDVRHAIGEYEQVQVYRCTVAGCGWRAEARDDGAWYRCTGCGRTWAMHNEINRLMMQQSNHRTLRACAHAVQRPVVTLKQWKSEGLIVEVGKDSKGHALYDLKEIEALSKRRAERERKSA